VNNCYCGRYHTPEELEAYPTIATLDGYTGGGYVFRLAGRDSELRDKLRRIQRAEWTNYLTRAIFVEFYTYNANVSGNGYGVPRRYLGRHLCDGVHKFALGILILR
jgi:hypothetical protein